MLRPLLNTRSRSFDLLICCFWTLQINDVMYDGSFHKPTPLPCNNGRLHSQSFCQQTAEPPFLSVSVRQSLSHDNCAQSR
jgi:hypothetical protein